MNHNISINVNTLKPGMSFLHQQEVYLTLHASHSKTGRGQARVKIKAKNGRTGAIVDIVVGGGVRITQAFLAKSQEVFQYATKDEIVVMNPDDFTTTEVPKVFLGKSLLFLTPDTKVEIIKYQGEVIKINLPPKITAEVIEAPPCDKGNSVVSAQKRVMIETKYHLMAPIFIVKGDKIIIDTETGSYVSRA